MQDSSRRFIKAGLPLAILVSISMAPACSNFNKAFNKIRKQAGLGGGSSSNGNQDPSGSNGQLDDVDPSFEEGDLGTQNGDTTALGDGGNTDLGPTCKRTENHAGFGGRTLDSVFQGYEKAPDTHRLKPYLMFGDEYKLYFGGAPDSWARKKSTLTIEADRWFEETQANAVSLVTLQGIHFEVGLRYAKENGLGKPDRTQAETECAKFQAMVWEMEPTQEQVKACADYIVNDTAKEGNAQRRWAYGFAAVLTAAGFLSY